MLCRNCGEFFNKNIKFCPVCGSQLMPDGADSKQDPNVTISAEKTYEASPNAAPPRPPFQDASESFNNRNSESFSNRNGANNNVPPAVPYRGGQGTFPPNSGFPPSNPNNMPPSGGKNGVNRTLIILICVLGTLIIICSAVFFIFYFQKGSGDESKADTAQTEASQTVSPTANNITEVTQPTTQPDNKVRVPDVKGEKYDLAMEHISAVGLTPELVLVEDNSVQADYVISQSPSADSYAEKGTKVTINVAKASAPTQTTQKPTEAPAPVDSGNTYYVIASEYATLRDAATRTGRELAKVGRGEKVNYISSDGEFYYVSFNGTKGYILSEFLSKNKDEINSGSGNASLKEGDYLYCRASDFATLRSSTSMSSSALAKINRDERVSYLGRSGDWYHVSYNGKTGYVLVSFFSPQADAPLNYNDY